MDIAWLPLGAFAALLAVAGYGLQRLRYRRQLQRRDATLAAIDQQRSAQALLAEMRAQGAALQALAAGLDRLELQLNLDARHAAPATRGGRAGYELAIRLAQGGASVDELCASCGMTRPEADLVIRLHRAGNSPATSRRLALAG